MRRDSINLPGEADTLIARVGFVSNWGQIIGGHVVLGGCSIETGRQSKEWEVPHGGKGGYI